MKNNLSHISFLKLFLSFSLLSFALFFSSTFAVHAQTTVSSCVQIENNLALSSRDGKNQNDVVHLQQFLNDKGFSSFKPTGYFGPLTQKAVLYFQKTHKLPATGFVGSITRKRIQDVTCSDEKILIMKPVSGSMWTQGNAGIISWDASKLLPSLVAYQYGVSIETVATPTIAYQLVKATTSNSVAWNADVSADNNPVAPGMYTLKVCLVNDASYCSSSRKLDIQAAATTTKNSGTTTLTTINK